MIEVLYMVLILIAFALGMLTKGVHIHITTTAKDQEFDTIGGYNQSTEDSLPPEIKEYFKDQQGFMNP